MKHRTMIFNGKNWTFHRFQTVVVGFGAAGLNGAVSLFKEGQKDIAVITEGRMMGTSRNTGSDKQTFYKLSLAGAENDSVRKMAQVLFAGGCVDGDLAVVEAATSLRSFFHLVDTGVPFPFNSVGEYVGYKTDHDPNKRGSSAGPLTSKFMVEGLERELAQYEIPVYDKYQVIELLTDEDETEPDQRRVRGLVAQNLLEQDPEKCLEVFLCDNIIYATGGEAGLYEQSVYPVSQTGGTGLALRAGARGKNLTESQYGIASIKFRWNLSGSYQQVLPCYISTDQDGGDEKEFLEEYFEDKTKLLDDIFLKGYQWPFDPRKLEGAASSIIDLLVYQEIVERGRRVYLDFRRNPSCAKTGGRFDMNLLSTEAREYLENCGCTQELPIERLEHMNPASIELYRSHGIDLYQELLEIAVCAQHNNGGLAGNCWWESNLKHFFPVGEVNGSHGVYRPGGSALNAGQAGSLRASQYIAHCYKDEALQPEKAMEHMGDQVQAVADIIKKALNRDDENVFEWRKEKKELGERMTACGANIRGGEQVEEAIEECLLQMRELEKKRVQSTREMAIYFRIRDLLVSQLVYLQAILDYIKQGGKSRGSYLIYDPNGKLPFEGLPEKFRFSLENGRFSERVQEIQYVDGECKIFWRDVRPIPPEDDWFEQVWKECREGTIYHKM